MGFFDGFLRDNKSFGSGILPIWSPHATPDYLYKGRQLKSHDVPMWTGNSFCRSPLLHCGIGFESGAKLGGPEQKVAWIVLIG